MKNSKIIELKPYQTIKNFKYVLLPGKFVDANFKHYYNEAYRLWKSVWKETFKELDGTENIFSDDFTRQDEIGALFDNEKCLMLSFFRMVDLSIQANRDDSYFKIWPDMAVQKLIQQGSLVLVGSNITIAPAFRSTHFGFPMKDLLMGLLVKRLIDTPAEVMTGTMRNNRGMDECAYRFGATPLLKGLIHHGVEVDLVGFFKSKVTIDSGVGDTSNLIKIIWDNRQYFPDGSIDILKKQQGE